MIQKDILYTLCHMKNMKEKEKISYNLKIYTWEISKVLTINSENTQSELTEFMEMNLIWKFKEFGFGEVLKFLRKFKTSQATNIINGIN